MGNWIINKPGRPPGHVPAASRPKRFMHCPRDYALYYSGKTPREPSGQGAANGGVFHAGMAQHYAIMGAEQGGVWVPDRTEPRRSVYVDDPAVFASPRRAMVEYADAPGNEKATLDDVLATYDEYVDKYIGDRNMRIHAVECWFQMYLPIAGEPFRLEYPDLDGVLKDQVWDKIPYAWLIDLVTMSHAWGVDNYRIWDHKGTGHWSGKQPRYYARDLQVLGMKWFGYQAWGERFNGFTLNGIQYQNTKSDGTVNAAKFKRPPLDAHPSLVRAFPRTVEYWLRQASQLQAQGLAPGDYPPATSATSCQTMWGLCAHARAETCGGI